MDTVKIVHRQDEEVEMEEVTVNGKQVAYGNYWDSHGYDRVEAIKAALDILKIPYTFLVDRSWDSDV